MSGVSIFRMRQALSSGQVPVRRWGSVALKASKRLVPIGLTFYFLPVFSGICLACGLVDVSRNRGLTTDMLIRYFFGNGIFTWVLSPFNLFMDLLTLPYRNKGIYELGDLPQEYQDEINSVMAAARRSDLVEQVARRMDGRARGMFFFKWYGKNCQTSLVVPEFHQPYRYIRTIGLSVFNKKKWTTEHFGPLRVTLRVLYNLNPIHDPKVYIQVGNHKHIWSDNQLFIFDDTLQHKSCNGSDKVRYCMFVDILRPSLFPRLLSGILSVVRLLMARCNRIFYKNWTFMK